MNRAGRSRALRQAQTGVSETLRQCVRDFVENNLTISTNEVIFQENVNRQR